MRILESALRPENDKTMCESILEILEGVILGSCSFSVERRSQPRTTQLVPLIPTVQVPRLTASRAYSTWKMWPSGEKMDKALSYPLIGEL